MSLLDDLPPGAVIGIDSAVVIYFIEAHPVYEPMVSPFFETRLQDGQNRAVTSVITLAEVLVQPIRDGQQELCDRYRDFLARGPSLTLVEITPSTAERAARLRALNAIRLPDALQLATAIEHGSEYFLTNDLRLKKVSELRVIALDDYV